MHEIKHLATAIEEHPGTALLTAAGVGAGIAAVVVTRGRALSEGAANLLPDLELTGKSALADNLTGAVETSAALRPPTLAERTTSRVAKLSFSTGKRILAALGKDWERDEPVAASDDVRRSVFNRFLSRLDQDRYVLYGSYPLESRNYIVRKAVTDLDFLSTDASLVKSTRTATDTALLSDLQRMLSKPMNDGVTFEIPQLNHLPPHVRLIQPKLRTAVAIAKDADGQEIMRIPMDIRVGAHTILDPVKVALKNPGGTSEAADATVTAMQPEENFAEKLYTYSNRTFGFTRKTKDLNDMSAMINHGLDDGKVAKALQAWTTRGYSLGPMAHPSELFGSHLADNLGGQTMEQLDTNFANVRNYYARIAPLAEDAPLLPGVKTSRLAQLRRFLEKQYIVHPVG